MLDIEFKPFTTGRRKHPLEPPNVIIFGGPTGSGKTTTALHVLEEINKQNDDLEEVYFFTGNNKDALLKVLGKDVKIMNDPAELSHLASVLNTEPPPSPHRVIMIDDCAAFKTMLNSQWFHKLIVDHRHHNVQILITCQGWHMIPKQVRTNATLIFLYATRNQSQRKDLLEEIPIDRSKLTGALNLIERGDRSFLMVNLQAQPPRMFHNFNKEL